MCIMYDVYGLEMATEGLTVLFKAERDDSKEDRYYEALTEMGLQCCVIPVLTFTYTNLQQLTECLKSPENYSGMVLTSPRAVEALVQSSPKPDEWQPLCAKWREKSVYVVGETTARLAEERLNLVTMGKESGNSEALADLIIQTMKGSENAKPILFPSGQLKKDTLPSKLLDAGINLDAFNVYLTEPHPDIKRNMEEVLESGVPEYVIYFSPSGVKFTEPIIKSLDFPTDETKFVAIGPSTKEALLAAGFHVHCTANNPTALDLAEAIREDRQMSVDITSTT